MGLPPVLIIGLVALPLDLSHVTGRQVSTRWRVTLPDREDDVQVTALNPQAWMDMFVPYWKGPVQVRGGHTAVIWK